MCKFAITRKNNAFVAKIVNTRLTEVFMVFSALAEMLPTSATRIHLRLVLFYVECGIFWCTKRSPPFRFFRKSPKEGGVCLNSKFFKEKIHHRGNKLVHHHRLKAKVEIAVKRNFLFSLKIASLSDGLPVRRR